MKSFLWIFVVFTCWFFVFGDPDAISFPGEIGDKCDGGICDLVTNCPEVSQNIRNRIYNHSVCGYHDKYQIICCPLPHLEEKKENAIDQLLRNAFSEVTIDRDTECITNNGHEPGQVIMAEFCREAELDESAAPLCGYEICADAVCCPYRTNSRQNKKCKLYHPDDKISLRLELHSPCTALINGVQFPGTYQKSCPGVQHIAKPLLDKVCDRELCDEWYCCPNDHSHSNAITCDLDIYHRPTVKFIGPTCFDTLLGRGEGTCRPRHQCHTKGTKIYDKCFVKNGVEFVCCPNSNFEHRSREEQTCADYSEQPYTEERWVAKPAVDQHPPLCIWTKNNSQKIEAEPFEFPHSAIFGYKSQEVVDVLEWRCAGSLISHQYVLTAANCLLSSFGPVELVRMGVTHLNEISNHDDCPEDYRAEQQIPHPGYSAETDLNDIGLIRLDRRVEFSPYIRPICLPGIDEIPHEAIALKWGEAGSNPGRGSILLKIKQNLFDFNACNIHLNGVLTSKTQFCANSMEVNGYFLSSSCSVFAGGSLSHDHEELHQMQVIHGVVSFGKECQPSSMPGVYTKVYPFINWIYQHVKDF